MNDERLTATEAAKIIGCTTENVRYLVRSKILKSKVHINPHGQKYYTISRSIVDDYQKTPQTKGWKRGRKRKTE